MLHCAILMLATAWADPGGQAPVDRVPASVDASFEEQLEGAKRLYFQGKRREALDLLSELQVRYLVAPESVAWESAAEALVYLGEVYYFTEDMERATSTWRILLEQAPDHPPLSPFAHPPEVAGEFERLRGIIRAEIAARPVPEPPPVPAWTVMPLGIPQFIDGRPGRGVLYGALQLGFGAGSIAMEVHLRSKNVSTDPHPLGWTIDQQRTRINTQRYGIQWPLTLAGYGAWLGSHLDARRKWTREHTVDADLAWTPRPDAPVHLTLSGRF